MIQVLLATYKGEQFLDQQLSSIYSQRNVNFKILISNDGAISQTTKHIVEKYQHTEVIIGPQQGAHSNFFNLIAHSDLTENFFSFSDQDDVWLPEKLAESTRILQQSQNPIALYMGKTIVCNEHLERLFLSQPRPKPLSFQNALLESAAGGNTMVLSRGSLKLIKAMPKPMAHDWLTYIAVSSCNGYIYFDKNPYVLYRQHKNNHVGNNQGFKAKAHRLYRLLTGEFRSWADDIINNLDTISEKMTDENLITFQLFKELHRSNGWRLCIKRTVLFQKAGLYRQKKLDHVAFFIAAFLGRL